MYPAWPPSPAPRIKLELARLLLRTGDNAGALALFRQVYLEKATPQKVRRNILPFIEQAELRVLRIRYGARIITDSNPSKVGEGGTVYFNGIPLEYQPPARKEVSYGIEPWFSAEKLWQNGYLTKLQLSARLFEDDDLRAGHLQLAVGKQITILPGLFVQANLDTGIARPNSYVLPTIESWKRFRLSDTAGGAGFGQGLLEPGVDLGRRGGDRVRSHACDEHPGHEPDANHGCLTVP